MEWWTNHDNDIMQIENEDTHVTELCARKVDGSWEYAIVRWRYVVPTLLCLFRNGKVLVGGDISETYG